MIGSDIFHQTKKQLMLGEINPLFLSYLSKLFLLPFKNYKTKKEIENDEQNQIKKETKPKTLFAAYS